MTLEDSYVDFIAVMPEGSIQYFKNKLKISSLLEIKHVFNQIRNYEISCSFYYTIHQYKNKIDELVFAIKDELIFRINKKKLNLVTV
jgi:hypothetical protein